MNEAETLVSSIYGAIEQSLDISSLKSALSSLVTYLFGASKEKEARQAHFLRTLFPSFSLFLFDHLLGEFSFAFCPSERKELIHIFFYQIPLSSLLASLCNYFVQVKQATPLNALQKQTIFFLFSLTHQRGKEWLHEMCTYLVANEWNSFCIKQLNLYLSIPDHLYNIIDFLSCEDINPQKISVTLVQLIRDWFQNPPRAGTEPFCKLSSHIFSKIIFKGGELLLSEHFFQPLIFHPSMVPFFHLLLFSFDDLLIDKFILLLCRYLSCLPDYDYGKAASFLESIFIDFDHQGNLVSEKRSLYDFIYTKLYFIKPVNCTRMIRLLVQFIALNLYKHQPSQVLHLCQQVAQTWADKHFLQTATREMQLYISRVLSLFLLVFTENIPENPEALLSSLLPIIPRGVMLRLESSILERRMQGMKVAEYFANFLAVTKSDLDISLHFNEADSYDLGLDDDIQDANVCHSLLTEKIRDSSKTESLESSDSEDDPDALYESHSDSDSDSESNSELLTPYDMSNDMKASEKMAPKYLSTLISALTLAPHDHEKDLEAYEKALESAEGLIKANPSNLLDFAPRLLLLLIGLQNESCFPNFSLHREKALVSLLAQVPTVIYDLLLAEIFAPEKYSLGQRLELLDIILNVCIKFNTENKIHPQQIEMKTEKIKSKEIGISRRWYSPENKKEEKLSFQNPFHTLAEPWFFGLHKYILQIEHPFFLSKCLNLLGIIVESSGQGGPCTFKLIAPFYTLLKQYRNAGDLEVRCATLMGINRLLRAIPPNIVLDSLPEPLPELEAWLFDVYSNDPDSSCRKLAFDAGMFLKSTLTKELSFLPLFIQ